MTEDDLAFFFFNGRTSRPGRRRPPACRQGRQLLEPTCSTLGFSVDGRRVACSKSQGDRASVSDCWHQRAALRGPWAPATDPPVRPHRTGTRRLRLPFCRGGGGERGCPLATPREGDSTEGTRAELSSPALETAGASKAAERTVRAADSPTLERWEPHPVRALEAPHTGTAGGALAAWSAARTAGGEPSAEGWTSRPREALSRRSC